MTEFQAAAEAVGKFAPDEETRKKFYQGFLGSLLGQVVMMMGAVLTYLGLIVAIFALLGDKVSHIRDVAGPAMFWSILVAPFALILVFNVLPTLWRGYRERRLKQNAFTGATGFTPGYFRLYPYSTDDAAQFRRLDGGDEKVIRWLLRSDDPVLYLSGPSGSGKSSLIEAALVPALATKGYRVVQARLFENPVAQVLEALSQAFPDLPPDPREAIVAAVQRARICDQTLLLVLDQFEEFLILHKAEDQKPFRELLGSLVAQPIPGFRLLLCLRSDYQALIFRDGLPHAAPDRNWFQLAPYRRGDAESFLQGGGRQLSPDALAAIFQGLDRIEETRGLYRPITLNMIGLVLERMGQQLEGDPQRLIQAYLRQSITSGDARDFAPPLLSTMITEAGTKEPRKVEDIATRTGLATWQVDATMATLAERGLVRALDSATWEVSHDFLARLIGQMIGRLRPKFAQRAAPFVGYLAMAGWVLVLAIGIPSALATYQSQIRMKIQKEFHGTFSMDYNDAFKGELISFNGIRQNQLNSLVKTLSSLSGSPNIYIFGKGIIDYTALNSINNRIIVYGFQYSEIDFRRLYGINNLSGFEYRIPSRDDIIQVGNIKNLTSLDLSLDFIDDIRPLANLRKLIVLNLSGSNVSDLGPISSLKSLTNLNLANNEALVDLRPLGGLYNLTSLNLSNDPNVIDLSPLAGLTLTLTDPDGNECQLTRDRPPPLRRCPSPQQNAKH